LISNVQSTHEEVGVLLIVGIAGSVVQDIGGITLVTRLFNCIFFMQLSVWLRPEARIFFTFVLAYRKKKAKQKRGERENSILDLSAA